MHWQQSFAVIILTSTIPKFSTRYFVCVNDCDGQNKAHWNGMQWNAMAKPVKQIHAKIWQFIWHTIIEMYVFQPYHTLCCVYCPCLCFFVWYTVKLCRLSSRFDISLVNNNDIRFFVEHFLIRDSIVAAFIVDDKSAVWTELGVW